MFLKKICIFLAVVFLAVDIFLLSLYIEANYNLKMLSDKMVESTVEYYDSVGIEMDNSIIVRKVPDNKIYTFYSDNASVAMQSAQRLAQELFSKEASVSVVETPDGPSYAITLGGETTASLRVYENSFETEYVSEGFSAENSVLSSEPFENIQKEVDSDTKKAIDKFAAALSGVSKPSYSINGSYMTSDRRTVSIQFNIDDKRPVEGMFLNIIVENSEIVYAKGNIILSEITKSYSEMLYDGVNALNKVDSTAVLRFVSEEIVYTQKYAGNGVYYLIPVWKIEYVDVDGKARTQYIDAIKG